MQDRGWKNCQRINTYVQITHQGHVLDGILEIGHSMIMA